MRKLIVILVGIKLLIACLGKIGPFWVKVWRRIMHWRRVEPIIRLGRMHWPRRHFRIRFHMNAYLSFRTFGFWWIWFWTWSLWLNLILIIVLTFSWAIFIATLKVILFILLETQQPLDRLDLRNKLILILVLLQHNFFNLAFELIDLSFDINKFFSYFFKEYYLLEFSYLIDFYHFEHWLLTFFNLKYLFLH